MQSLVVLDKSGQTEAWCDSSSVAVDALDPVFQSFASVNLPSDAQEMGQRTTNFLSHSVARDPSCLLTHAQRIALHVKRKEVDAVRGALLDLFIVLGKRGTPLRERMLKIARPLLDPAASKFFLSTFRHGISATDAFPSSAYSVLAKGIHGTTELVRQLADQRITDRDPLEDARECLEFGQVDGAKRILETALHTDPDREEIHRDLLEIYRYTANQEDFNAMRIQLESKNHPLLPLWDDMADSFQDASNQ